MMNLTARDRALELIKHFEGFESRAYVCPGGKLTIGYGHTKTVKDNDEITEEQAERLLRYDLKDAENAINALVEVPLAQNQFDALVSFIYNIGAERFRKSTMLRYINRGDFKRAAKEFSRWKYAGGIIRRGLVRRRAAERALFEGTRSQ